MKKPLILISNDDGYSAKGIAELVSFVGCLGDVIVCAPEGVRSGKSRAFSMGELTLRHLRTDTLPDCGNTIEWYACSGTPVDCVKIAYQELCPRCPDLVLGGINHGDNSSTNAHYSGTVGIAFEAALKGIPAIAFSLCDYDADADFSPVRPVVELLCRRVIADGLPRYTCLNVNVPKCVDGGSPRGMKVCRMAYGGWCSEVEPFGGADGSSYQLKGFYRCDEPEADDTDRWALDHGYVSVTPCTVDITCHAMLKSVTSLLS